MSDRPYSRHYHELVDDPKFEDIYPDDHHYACWSRLLMLAEQAWPASAHLPATARKASVAKLAEVGLIDLLPDGRFRMHGLQAERERRSIAASKAANRRWAAERNAAGNADRTAGADIAGMPRRDETRQEETNTPNPLAEGATKRANGTNPRAVAAALTRANEEAERARKSRRQARYLAYSRGQITEAQRIDMDDRDAPLSEISYQGVPA